MYMYMYCTYMYVLYTCIQIGASSKRVTQIHVYFVLACMVYIYMYMCVTYGPIINVQVRICTCCGFESHLSTAHSSLEKRKSYCRVCIVLCCVALLCLFESVSSFYQPPTYKYFLHPVFHSTHAYAWVSLVPPYIAYWRAGASQPSRFNEGFFCMYIYMGDAAVTLYKSLYFI